MDVSQTKERIERILMNFSLSVKEFCQKTGIQQYEVESILNGNKFTSLEIMQQICSVFPQINARWLLLGKGDFLMPFMKEEITENKLLIKITVVNVKLPLFIPRKHELTYRAAGMSLKENINEYRLLHSEFTIESILKTIGYRFALQSIKNENYININELEKFTKKCFHRKAAISYRTIQVKYKNRYPDFELEILNTIIAYHFAFKNQCLLRV